MNTGKYTDEDCNEFISDEKALFNIVVQPIKVVICLSLLGIQGVTHMRTLVRKCKQYKTRKMALFTSVTGVQKQWKWDQSYKRLYLLTRKWFSWSHQRAIFIAIFAH